AHRLAVVDDHLRLVESDGCITAPSIAAAAAAGKTPARPPPPGLRLTLRLGRGLYRGIREYRGGFRRDDAVVVAVELAVVIEIAVEPARDAEVGAPATHSSAARWRLR